MINGLSRCDASFFFQPDLPRHAAAGPRSIRVRRRHAAVGRFAPTLARANTMRTPVVVLPPVRGEWSIFNPPGHAPLAHDFLAVDRRRSPYKGASLARHLFSRISVDETLTWAMPVYAVLPGTVLVASDGAADRPDLSMIRDLFRLMFFGPKVQPPFSNLGGNHVILDCGGVFPLYAHLRRGSLQVRAGQTVAAGQPLGAVGNSGSSLQPHLHFQVMSTPNPFPLFRNLVPYALSEADCRRDGQWVAENSHVPASGDHYRFA